MDRLLWTWLLQGELLMLGFELSQTTVAKYMERPRKPPSETWRTFLDSHLKQLVSTDFFVVPTVNFRILFVFVVLAHHRRRVIHFNVTAHPCPYQRPPFVRVLLTTKLIRLPEPIGFVWNAMGRLRSTAQTDQANGTSR